MIEVCVVGELNLDLILYGLPEDLVPDREHWPAIWNSRLEAHPEFRAQLVRAGTRVGFISKIRTDPPEKMAADRLQEGAMSSDRWICKIARLWRRGITE